MKTKVFTPAKKGDRLGAAYLGQDGSIVATFERTSELGTREEYAQVHTRAVTIALYGSDNAVSLAGLSRIVFYEPGLLAIPLATGQPVRVDIYMDNSSETAKAAGIKVESLYISVPGMGAIVASNTRISSGGFTIQGPIANGTFDGNVAAMSATTLRSDRARWCDNVRILRFDDPSGAATEAA
jgi:hypothetical protein